MLQNITCCTTTIYTANFPHSFPHLPILVTNHVISKFRSNYNKINDYEIYKGRGNTYKLVVRRTNTSDMAAIELPKINFNGVEMYKINTATPVKTKQLCQKELLCANDH